MRFQRIDASNIGDHYNLVADDECYFMFEYTSGQDYSFSETNSLISNLKKKPSTAATPSYKYKRRAEATCSANFTTAINAAWLPGAVLVPVPPSKARNHPDYDDRITRICRGITNAVVRELVVQSTSMDAAHETTNRPTVDELVAAYSIDQSLVAPAPGAIAIVDDVLTAGTHYRAVHTVLQRQFPGVKIVGFFIARRVFPPTEFGPVDFNF